MTHTLFIKTGSGQKRKVREVMVETLSARKTFSGKGRAGRPRKLGVPRDANGRPLRTIEGKKIINEMTRAEALSVGLEARRRHLAEVTDKRGQPILYRLDDQDAEHGGKPNVGTTHGLLTITGHLTVDQFNAAQWYLHQRRNYLSAILAPPEEQSVGGRNHGLDDSEQYVALCDRHRSTWAAIQETIREQSISTRSPIAAAFDHVLVRQQMLEHMVGDLRSGLNAIDNAFLQRKGS